MNVVMTVVHGRYGAKVLKNILKKVQEIRKLKPKVKIEIESGMNLETIDLAYNSGANQFVIGSFLQEKKNPKKAMEDLKVGK